MPKRYTKLEVLCGVAALATYPRPDASWWSREAQRNNERTDNTPCQMVTSGTRALLPKLNAFFSTHALVVMKAVWNSIFLSCCYSKQILHDDIYSSSRSAPPLLSKLTNSQSNTKVAPGGIVPPAPREPNVEWISLHGRWISDVWVLTVGHIRRDSECALLLDTHTEETFVPTPDDLANTDCREGADEVLTIFGD
jgi:hypothetical protein